MTDLDNIMNDDNVNDNLVINNNPVVEMFGAQEGDDCVTFCNVNGNASPIIAKRPHSIKYININISSI